MAITQPTDLWELNNSLVASVGGLTLTNASGTYTTGLLGGATGARSTSAAIASTNATLYGRAAGTHSGSFWFKLNFLATDNAGCNLFFGSTTGISISLLTNWDGGSSLRIGISVDDTNYTDVTGDVISGNWVNVTWVRNTTNNTFKVYVNGTEIISTTSTGAAVPLAFTNRLSLLPVFGAKIFDQIAIWNVALSTSEIAELYNAGAGLAWADPWGTIASAPNSLGIGYFYGYGG